MEYNQINKIEYAVDAPNISNIDDIKSHVSQQKDCNNRTGFNLKDRVFSFGAPQKIHEDLIDEIKRSDTNICCRDHPDEEIQFYSFTQDRALCSECILSGTYRGCEVLNLKKATEKIKSKFNEFVEEINNKIDEVDTWKTVIETKSLEFDNINMSFKTDITSLFNHLRLAINKKQNELLERAEKIVEEKKMSIQAKCNILDENNKKLLEFQEMLIKKLNDSKEIDICQYYSSRAKIIKKCLNEDFNLVEIRNFNPTFCIENLREQCNIDAYQKEISKIIEYVNNINDILNKKQELKQKIVKEHLTSHINKEKENFMMEKGSTSLTSKSIGFFDEISAHPFKDLRKELGSPSPANTNNKEISSKSSVTDPLKRIFKKVEKMKKDNHEQQIVKEIHEPKNSFRSQSTIKGTTTLNLKPENFSRFNLDIQKEREPSHRAWDRSEDQDFFKTTLISPTSRVGNSTPKNYITNFIKLRTNEIIIPSPARKDLLNCSLPQEFISPKNIKKSNKNEPLRQHTNWKIQ